MSLKEKLANWKAKKIQGQIESDKSERIRIGRENARLIAQANAEEKLAKAVQFKQGIMERREKAQKIIRGKRGSGWDTFDRGVASFGSGVGRAVQSFDKAVDTLVPPQRGGGSRPSSGGMFNVISGGGGGGFNPITGERYGGSRHAKKHGGTHYVKRHGKYVKVGKKHGGRRHGRRREYSEQGGNTFGF